MDFRQLEETCFISLSERSNAVFSMSAAQLSAHGGMERLLAAYAPLFESG